MISYKGTKVSLMLIFFFHLDFHLCAKKIILQLPGSNFWKQSYFFGLNIHFSSIFLEHHCCMYNHIDKRIINKFVYCNFFVIIFIIFFLITLTKYMLCFFIYIFYLRYGTPPARIIKISTTGLRSRESTHTNI